MNRFVRKTTITTATVVAALALATSSAFAHYCYNASRSDQGNASAANAPVLVTIPELLAHFGMCEAGIDIFMEGLEELDVIDTSVLINTKALMAGGLEGKDIGDVLLYNGKGIDHLPESEEIDDLFVEAFAICFGGEE